MHYESQVIVLSISRIPWKHTLKAMTLAFGEKGKGIYNQHAELRPRQADITPSATNFPVSSTSYAYPPTPSSEWVNPRPLFYIVLANIESEDIFTPYIRDFGGKASADQRSLPGRAASTPLIILIVLTSIQQCFHRTSLWARFLLVGLSCKFSSVKPLLPH